MKDLKEIIAESIFDMDDRDLDVATSDLWNIYNSKSQEEFIERCKYLSLRLSNIAEKAPYDNNGYLVRKSGRRYIIIYKHNGKFEQINFGPDKNGYRMYWHERSNKVKCEKLSIIDYTNCRIDPEYKSGSYKENPYYIMPKDLDKSYLKLTRWIR